MARADLPDYYELLDLPPTATADEVQTAYRRLARTVHPDRGGNAGMFRLISQAADTLSDSEGRRQYDRTRTSPASPTASSSATGTRPASTAADRGSPAEFHPADLQWWAAIDPDQPITVLPAFGRHRRSAYAAAGLLAALTVALALTWSPHYDSGPVTLFLLVAAAAATTASVRGWTSLRRNRLTAVAALATVTLAAAAALDHPSPPAVALTLSWLAAWFAAPVLIRRRRRALRLDRAMSPADLEQLRIFGRPSTATHRPDPSGRLAAEDLQVLCRIPAVRICHGLTNPGTGAALADHAVICGRKVAAIASRTWPAGRISFDQYWEPRHNGRALAIDDPHLAGTMARLRELLPAAEIIGFLMIYPDPPHRTQDVDPGQDPPWLAGTPGFVVNAVGTWFDADPTTVDRELLHALIDMATG